MIDLEILPEGENKVTIVLTDKENPIGAVELIKCLAHYIQILIKQHSLDFSDVKISKDDKIIVQGK